MMPFRQGNFSESSGGGRIVWSWTSFLTHRCGWRTRTWGEGSMRQCVKRLPPTGTLGDRSLPWKSLRTIAWGEGRSRQGDPRLPPTGTLGDRSLPWKSLRTIAWGEGSMRQCVKQPSPTGILGDRSLPTTMIKATLPAAQQNLTAPWPSPGRRSRAIFS